MQPRTPRTLSLTLAALLALLPSAAVPAAAQDAEPSPSPAPGASPSVTEADTCVEPEVTPAPLSENPLSIPEEARIALFEGVWQGIRDYYWDVDTAGLDWDAIGDEYAPLIIQTDNAYEVYELLEEMVGLLDDPFTSFYADPAPYDPSYGGIGALLDTSAAGQDSPGLRILYVFDGGSAKEAGIRARDRIIGVDGDPCARIAEIRGPAGTDVTLTVVSPGEEPLDITLERRQIDPVTLPTVRRLEADPSVGYLGVLALSGETAVDAIEQALTELLRGDPLEGLVLDLRASNQGAPLVTISTLATFVGGEVGEYHSRVENQPIEIEPNHLADDYAGIPLVVLVDGDTEADAEQLAAILQDQGSEHVVGSRSSGKTHGATIVDLPAGSLLQIVAYGFQLPDGRTLEGEGVTPDVLVEEDWLSYPEVEDPYVLAALEALASVEETPAG